MDNHCAMCGEYLADASRIICEKCEKGETKNAHARFYSRPCRRDEKARN